MEDLDKYKIVCPICSGNPKFLDVPKSPDIAQCQNCQNLLEFKPDDGEFMLVTQVFERLGQGDDRLRAALSDEHIVKVDSVMELITSWRARTEMDTLSTLGLVQQRLALLDNRLHSIKKRLAESLLGEPRPIDTEQILELVDECIDLASPAPARERGLRKET